MTYTEFLLRSLALAALLSAAASWIVPYVPAGSRRPVGLLVLSLPLFVLALVTAHLLPRYWNACATLTGGDPLLSLGLLALVWGSVAGALILNLLLLRRARRLVLACPPVQDPDLLGCFATLSRRLKAPVPELRVLELPAPVAFSGWGSRPVVVISRWFLDRLDRAELVAVLAHELGHLARRAPQALWLARVMRDATWYLPWTRRVVEPLEAEEELEADAFAVRLTGQPMALASALGRLTEHALLAGAPLPAFGSSPERVLEYRLRCLLEGRARPDRDLGGRLLAGGLAVVTVRAVPSIVASSAAALPLYCRIGPL